MKLEDLNNYNVDLTDKQEANQKILFERLSKVEKKYGKPLTVTSGVRAFKKHCDIYEKKGVITQTEADEYQKIHDSGKEIPNCKIPQHSKHLDGCAVDIEDHNEELAKWNHDNEDFLKEVGLWMEATESTKGWEHYQMVPPASGHRFFKP